MNRNIGFWLGLALVLGPALPSSAQILESIPLEVRVTDSTKRLGKEKIDDETLGKGEKEKFQNTYAAEVRNASGTDTIAGIKLRLIPFFKPHEYFGRDTPLEIGGIQEKDNLSFVSGESRRIDFDPDDFEINESRNNAGPGATIYYSGREYGGVVLEVYQSGKLVGCRFDGDVKLRKAYEDWVAKGSPLPSKTSKRS